MGSQECTIIGIHIRSSLITGFKLDTTFSISTCVVQCGCPPNEIIQVFFQKYLGEIRVAIRLQSNGLIMMDSRNDAMKCFAYGVMLDDFIWQINNQFL